MQQERRKLIASCEHENTKYSRQSPEYAIKQLVTKLLYKKARYNIIISGTAYTLREIYLALFRTIQFSCKRFTKHILRHRFL